MRRTASAPSRDNSNAWDHSPDASARGSVARSPKVVRTKRRAISGNAALASADIPKRLVPLREGEDFGAVGGEGHGVFGVGASGSVGGAEGPAVFVDAVGAAGA